MATHQFLAFDLGAESGRAVLGTLKQDKIRLEVIHRFPTQGLVMLGTRQWDLARIYDELCQGLAKCAREHTPRLDGIAVDTWGVDFGLIAEDGAVLANPVHYRDKRTEGMQDLAFSMVPRDEVYMATGIQFLPFNTLYQLLSLVHQNSPLLKVADKMLLMGDLLAYLLSGQAACEYTNASTTQLLDPHTKTWHDGLIAKMGIPRHWLLPPTMPGTILGAVLPEVAERTGVDPGVPVIASASHDTASAVVAVPATDEGADWAYLSSGTWSLLGAELPAPHITTDTLALDFTNEGGANGTIRFLKNIFGLWIVQECRRAWAKAGDERTYAQLTEEAGETEPFRSIISLDDTRLLAPDDMPGLIRTMCRETNQPVPETRGQVIRCALESLALTYRRTLRAMDHVLDRKTERLHIIGGGVQNRLLCQMTADACGIPVTAGPIEATALGNIAVQAMAKGIIGSLSEARRIIANSFEMETYEPVDFLAWDNIAQTRGLP
jgi:rhamnulokinase